MRLTVGQTLRKCRKAAGLTLREVERRSGVPYNSISNYENDKTFPSLMTAVELAEVYGIPLDALVGRDWKARTVK